MCSWHRVIKGLHGNAMVRFLVLWTYSLIFDLFAEDLNHYLHILDCIYIKVFYVF